MGAANCPEAVVNCPAAAANCPEAVLNRPAAVANRPEDVANHSAAGLKPRWAWKVWGLQALDVLSPQDHPSRSIAWLLAADWLDLKGQRLHDWPVCPQCLHLCRASQQHWGLGKGMGRAGGGHLKQAG